MENQFVIFNLAEEPYAVNIAAVDSIIKLQPITYVPHAPKAIIGVTNLRGKVLPVLDLRRRFELPVQEPTKLTRIIVAILNANMVGMLVDSVTEVRYIPSETVEPPSPLVTTLDSAFITGIAKIGERLIILLDLDKVLSPQEKSELQGLPIPTEPALPNNDGGIPFSEN